MTEDCCKPHEKKWISLVIFFVLIGIAYFAFTGNSKTDESGLPSYALINNEIKEAYLYAKTSPEQLDGINCHCGCMIAIHNARIHKRGLLDCFIKEDGSFDSHGASCEMCYKDSLQAKRLYYEGKTKEEIKRIIDSKYE